MAYSTNKYLSKHKASVYDIHDYFGIDHILSAIRRKDLTEEQVTKLQVFSIKRVGHLIDTGNFAEEHKPDTVEGMEDICKKLKENSISNLVNVDMDILLEALELKRLTKRQAEKLQDVVTEKVKEEYEEV